METRGWITSTWKDLQQFDMTIGESTTDISMRTSIDQLIVPAFANAGFKSDKLALLNRMRLYLRDATLSDLMQANGKDVKLEVWHGINPQNCRNNFILA